MKSSVAAVFISAFVALQTVLHASPACAQVKPGDVITISNAAKVRDLVSPGVYYKVVHGMGLKIVPTSQLDWPPPYTEATEKNSSQGVLAPRHWCALRFFGG